MLRLKEFVAEGIGPETLAVSFGRKRSSDRRAASINSPILRLRLPMRLPKPLFWCQRA